MTEIMNTWPKPRLVTQTITSHDERAAAGECLDTYPARKESLDRSEQMGMKTKSLDQSPMGFHVDCDRGLTNDSSVSLLTMSSICSEGTDSGGSAHGRYVLSRGLL